MDFPGSLRGCQPRQLFSSAAPPPSTLRAALARKHLPARASSPPSAPPVRSSLSLRAARRRLLRASSSSLGGEEEVEDEEAAAPRRPRFLCLHGFRTSAEIMRRQVVGRWPPEVTARLDLVFADAPFPAEGASAVAGVFDLPYYEWFQFVGEDFLKYRSLERCFSYLEDLMAREGPFDGLLGFSQGAVVSAMLAGLQQQGLALTGVAKVKYVIAIAGAKIQATDAFASKIRCPSLHFIGDDDFVKVHSEELVAAFADPLVIRHPCGHTIPKLDDNGLQVMLSYLDKIEKELSAQSSTGATVAIHHEQA